MQDDITKAPFVACETCGNRYYIQLERCPRCQSNQNSELPELAKDLLIINRWSDQVDPVGHRNGVADVGSTTEPSRR